MKFVVGDIHGEVSKLKKLIFTIIAFDKTPEFIFIGDYLDKGEDVRQTLLYLNELAKEYSCIFLIGNHEFLWMNLLESPKENTEYLLKYGGLETVNSFSGRTILETQKLLLMEFGDFFSKLVPYWMNDNLVAVHSGIDPQKYSQDITSIPLKDFLFNRYNFISFEALYLNKFRIIFGHTGFYYPYYSEYRIGIDTSACFMEKQPLTAFCIENESFYNSNNQIYLGKALNKSACPNIIRVKPWRYAN